MGEDTGLTHVPPAWRASWNTHSPEHKAPGKSREQTASPLGPQCQQGPRKQISNPQEQSRSPVCREAAKEGSPGQGLELARAQSSRGA